jgi:putative ABC transport system substrate-binding protein
MGVTVLPVELKSPQGLDAAFSAIAAHRPDALQVLGDSGNLDFSDRIAALALAQRLASFSSVSTYAEYGPARCSVARRLLGRSRRVAT